MRANSIIMKLEKAEGEESEYDFERSKFFGSPVFNKEVIEKEVDFNEIFIAQINLEDIGYYDKDKMLPKTGYLSFFYNEETKKMHVIYHTKDINNVIIDYNKHFDRKNYTTAFYISFDSFDEIIVDDEIRFSSVDRCKLLGFAYDNIKKSEITDDDILLLQIDSLSTPDFPILPGIGMGYVFINKNDLKKKKFNNLKFISFRN